MKINKPIQKYRDKITVKESDKRAMTFYQLLKEHNKKFNDKGIILYNSDTFMPFIKWPN